MCARKQHTTRNPSTLALIPPLARIVILGSTASSSPHRNLPSSPTNVFKAAAAIANAVARHGGGRDNGDGGGYEQWRWRWTLELAMVMAMSTPRASRVMVTMMGQPAATVIAMAKSAQTRIKMLMATRELVAAITTLPMTLLMLTVCVIVINARSGGGGRVRRGAPRRAKGGPRSKSSGDPARPGLAEDEKELTYASTTTTTTTTTTTHTSTPTQRTTSMSATMTRVRMTMTTTMTLGMLTHTPQMQLMLMMKMVLRRLMPVRALNLAIRVMPVRYRCNISA